MNSRTTRTRVVARRVFPLAVLAFALLAILPSAQAQSVAAGVCPVLAKLLPEVRTYKPEGARAQLVMAVAEKFDYDAGKLRQVRTEVDAATTAACPREREGMLGVLKTKSLAEALS
jgi:hypothetical protein